MRLQRIWSRTHLIPGFLLHHFLSPWTKNQHRIDPPGQMVLIKFGPHGQWSPKIRFPWSNSPPISGSPQPVPLDKWNILGIISPGGPNWLGTFCPWGSNFWDHLSTGTELVGDRLPRGTNQLGTNSGGPNVSQS